MAGKSSPVSETETFKLPSGKTLMVTPAPWRVAENLNDVLIEQGNGLPAGAGAGDVAAILKRLVLSGFGNKKLKSAIWACMDTVLLDKQRVTEETFEPAAARADYHLVLYYVAEVNVRPFMKSLAQQLSVIGDRLGEQLLEQKSETAELLPNSALPA